MPLPNSAEPTPGGRCRRAAGPCATRSDARSAGRSPGHGWRRPCLRAIRRRRAWDRRGRCARACFDEVKALIQAIAADHGVVGDGQMLCTGSLGPDHVLAPHREGVDPQLAAQFVDGGLDGERGLRRAVAAEGAGRHGVGVDRVAGALLVRAAVGGHRRSRGTRRGSRRRGCRRRRCWKRCGSASRSACRPSSRPA